VVSGGVLVLVLGNKVDAVSATALQAIGCAAAMIVLGPKARRILSALYRASWQPFRRSLRQHGRWTLLGVATTEATSNAHAYLVGFFAGPAAFAPIAAVTLFFRPVTILTQALTQYERPKMAKVAQLGQRSTLSAQVRQFGLVSVAAWILNTAAVLTLLWLVPGIIGNESYSPSAVELSAMLLAAVFLLRAVRGGASAALQAVGEFRPLAMASIIAAPITVLGVVLAQGLLAFDAAWSLLGVVAGEAVLCVMILATLRRRLEAI
jgi:O-antigen/teichoic acid export membrane protein